MERQREMSEQLSGLYKTNIVLWSAYPILSERVSDLAKLALRDGYYMPTVQSQLVPSQCLQDDSDPGGSVVTNVLEVIGTVPLWLLCDRCFGAVTNEPAQCQTGCGHDDLDHEGACLWVEGPVECEWCGLSGRLTPVLGDQEGIQILPTVGGRDEGQWWLNWLRESHGPFPSRDAAWDAWRASTD